MISVTPPGGVTEVRSQRCSKPSFRAQGALDRAGELLDELRQLRLARVVRGRHDDRVALDAADVARAGINDQTLFERAAAERLTEGAFGGEGLPGGPVAHELDTDEIAPATH